MPNRLRSKIKHLACKGELNEHERDRILNALDREERTHFVETEDRYRSLMDGTKRIILSCAKCRNVVISVYNYCPMCGRKFDQPPKMMCEED